ncbi:MAG: YdcH family protein [Alphaproteobacteria bacterium]
MSEDLDNDMSDEPEKAEMLVLLETLKSEHRRVDKEINALIETGVADMLKVKRMKKVKLSIKDQMVYLENQLTPDIIA